MLCKFQDGYLCIYTCWWLSGAYCPLVYFSDFKNNNESTLSVCLQFQIHAGDLFNVALCFCWLTSNRNFLLFCIVWGCMHWLFIFALLYHAIIFIFGCLIFGKTKGEWFCRKGDGALISGNLLYFPVLSFYILLWAILSFLLGSFGYGGQRWCQQLRQKLYQGLDCFEPYNADPPNGSSQSCCLFAIAIDRTYSAKQNDNWLELYELIVTFMAYHCYPDMWKFCIRYMEFIQHVQNNVSVYRILLSVTLPWTECLKLDIFMSHD
jgi:hypothetical protein